MKLLLTLSISAVLLVAIAAAFFVWTGAAPAAIVLFLKNRKQLDVHQLARVLSDATGRNIRAIEMSGQTPGDENKPAGDDWVIGKPPTFIAALGGTHHTIHSFGQPYMPNPASAAESLSDLRLRKAVAEHKAWLSVDIIRLEPGKTENYSVVGRAVASLIDADCLALYHPPLNQFVACTSPEELIAALKTADPIASVFRNNGDVPFIEVPDDPRMQAAEAEARSKFSQFVSALRSGGGTDFAVKAKIAHPKDPAKSEHIWVDVETISGNKIMGRLGNHPFDLGELKRGSRVAVNAGEIEDWVFLRDGKPVGLFTVAVIQKIEQERSKGK